MQSLNTISPTLFEVIPYLVFTLALGLCVCLFILLKAEIHRKSARWDYAKKEMEQSLQLLRLQIQRLQESLHTTVQEAALNQAPTTAPPRQAINLNRRVQVLRLHKRGERPDQIAAAVGIPQNEVELMLKLQAAHTAAS
ncbi:MAG: hypothetical protein FJW20_03575 [Acidimicrobiia bacterium]|nr:hypothetical protein [Acidimicrobiia bacterium]